MELLENTVISTRDYLRFLKILFWMVVLGTICSQKIIEKFFGLKKETEYRYKLPKKSFFEFFQGFLYHGTKPKKLGFFFKISESESLRSFFKILSNIFKMRQ